MKGKSQNKKTKAKPSTLERTNKFLIVEDFIKQNYTLRYNIVINQVEYFANNEQQKKWKQLNEYTIYNNLKRKGLSITMTDLISLLNDPLFVEEVNPILEYFESLNYDGGNHIQNLCNHIQISNKLSFHHHFKKHLVRAVKCVIEEDYFNKQCLVLVAQKQNDGKSSFLRFLVPPELKQYFSEGEIDPKNKDDKLKFASNFLINLDDINPMNYKINALKSLFSSEYVNERPPYGRKSVKFPRRASLVGTTNEIDFLSDIQNVRWLLFEVESINFDYNNRRTGVKNVNINDVWAEAYHLYKSGFYCDLTKEEEMQNEDNNINYRVVSSEGELVQRFYKIGTKANHDTFLTATDIMEEITWATRKMIRINKYTIGRELKSLGFNRHSYRTQNGSKKGYFVIRTEKLKEDLKKVGMLYDEEKVNLEKSNEDDGLPF